MEVAATEVVVVDTTVEEGVVVVADMMTGMESDS